MKVTLKKEIQLQSAIVYLRFEKEIERTDIQKYLNDKPFEKPLIENRIREYLKNINVYDEKYQLTDLGNAVKGSGMLPTVEEGKYQIWFTDRDSYFGSKIFYFKRVRPLRESNDKKLILPFGKEDVHFYLPTKNNTFSKLKLLPITYYFGQKEDHTDVISLRWNWDNLEKSDFIFDGQLGKGEGLIKFIAESITCNDDLKACLEELLPDWDKKNERLKVPFNQKSDDFEKYLQIKWKDFQVEFHEIPLMPSNLEEAKKWRNSLLVKSLIKKYLNPSDFESLVIETNEKEAFKAYSNSLDIPKPELFSNSNLIKKDALAFWHLNAPLNLNPNAKTRLSTKPIELKKDEKISFKSIVNKLRLDNSDKDSVCIYYDRYVIKEHQQRAVAALLETIISKSKIVVTDTSRKENGSDFIQKQRPELKIEDYKTIFKNRSAHDRYLIIGNKNEIQTWNISNSIDYIMFSDRNIRVDTVGTIRQSVVFTPVSKELLDKELLNFLEDKIKNDK